MPEHFRRYAPIVSKTKKVPNRLNRDVECVTNPFIHSPKQAYIPLASKTKKSASKSNQNIATKRTTKKRAPKLNSHAMPYVHCSPSGSSKSLMGSSTNISSAYFSSLKLLQKMQKIAKKLSLEVTFISGPWKKNSTQKYVPFRSKTKKKISADAMVYVPHSTTPSVSSASSDHPNKFVSVVHDNKPITLFNPTRQKLSAELNIKRKSYRFKESKGHGNPELQEKRNTQVKREIEVKRELHAQRDSQLKRSLDLQLEREAKSKESLYRSIQELHNNKLSQDDDDSLFSFMISEPVSISSFC